MSVRVWLTFIVGSFLDSNRDTDLSLGELGPFGLGGLYHCNKGKGDDAGYEGRTSKKKKPVHQNQKCLMTNVPNASGNSRSSCSLCGPGRRVVSRKSPKSQPVSNNQIAFILPSCPLQPFPYGSTMNPVSDVVPLHFFDECRFLLLCSDCRKSSARNPVSGHKRLLSLPSMLIVKWI